MKPADTAAALQVIGQTDEDNMELDQQTYKNKDWINVLCCVLVAPLPV